MRPRFSLALHRNVLRHDGQRWWYEALLDLDGREFDEEVADSDALSRRSVASSSGTAPTGRSSEAPVIGCTAHARHRSAGVSGGAGAVM
jgi:hypothetical protein